METLSFKGVRCFGDPQRLDIRPVTLLIGENSSGKSTVLAMVRAAWDVAFGADEPDFNEEPFDLGGYDAIAYYHGGQGKRAHDFRIGATFRMRGRRPVSLPAGPQRFSGTFTERAGQPVLTAWEASWGDVKLEASYLSAAKAEGAARIVVKERGKVLWKMRGTSPRGMALIGFARGAITGGGSERAPAGLPLMALEHVLELLFRAPPSQPRPIPLAPVRTKPSRTYDPKREVREPEGSHVPMVLATLSRASPKAFAELATHIEAYGKESNLFSKLRVRRLGKMPGDPFQLTVAVDGHAFNLRDVGYGVSQVLPILAETFNAPAGQTFLLQQPEVHLHPRAQAALGSLFVQQAASRRQTFVVATHSDYLVDRVHMDIRDRKTSLKPTDVVILYFERVAGQATVHPISLDDQGNLVDVPRGYRSFFLEEERRLLGISGFEQDSPDE